MTAKAIASGTADAAATMSAHLAERRKSAATTTASAKASASDLNTEPSAASM